MTSPPVFLLSALLLFRAHGNAAAKSVVVETTGGAVVGDCSGSGSGSDTTTSHCSWVGIPFAEPPTPENNGRFAPPRPLGPSRWSGVRNARRSNPNPGKACYQTPYDPSTPQSEDCLHLTV